MGRGLIVGANLLIFTAIVGACFFSFGPMVSYYYSFIKMENLFELNIRPTSYSGLLREQSLNKASVGQEMVYGG